MKLLLNKNLLNSTIFKRLTKGLNTCLLFFLISNLSGQKIDYKSKHIEGKERGLERTLIQPPDIDNNANDYESYKKAKAWNYALKTNSILTDTKQIGPMKMGGRVRSSLVDTINNIYLVAPSGGGLWNFNPLDGSSFTPINDFGQFMAIMSIDQDPFSPQTIYISTGSNMHNTVGNGVFKSIDGGQSFNQLISTDPQTNPTLKFISKIKCSPTEANTLYIASQNKLYKSSDGGSSWTQVFDAGNNIKEFDFTGLSGLLVAVNFEGIYKSNDGSPSSFTKLDNGIRSSGTRGCVVASSPSNTSIAYAYFINKSTSVHELFKTLDSGNSWMQVNVPSYSVSQSTFCLTIGISPNDPDKVILGNVGWAYSTDGGNLWVNGCGLEVDFHDVHFHSSNPNVAYIGYDQGIGRVDFSAMDSTICWSPSPHREYQPAQIELGKQGGFNTSQIYYGDYFPQSYGDAIIEGQQDGGCFTVMSNSLEGRVTVGDGGAIFINKQNPNKAFVSTQNGNIKSTNTATTASFSYSSTGTFNNNHPNWITQFAGNNTDGNQLYIASNDSIYKTLDGGLSYKAITNSSALGGTIIGVSHESSPTLYAIGYKSSTTWNSDLIKVENANNSDAAIIYSDILNYSTDGFPDRIYVDPNDKYTVYITTTSGNAYRLSNLNTSTPTKNSIKGDISNVRFNVVIGVQGSPNVLIAGTNVGLFYSEDLGISWTLSNEIPHTKVNDLKLRQSDSRLFIFTYGRGAWASTLNLIIASTDELKRHSFMKAFPNPANDIINIEIQGNQNELSNTKISIYNILGDVVLQKNMLNSKTKLNLEDFSNGSYILHLSRENKVIEIEKLIITH
jgi:hypothetical protein